MRPVSPVAMAIDTPMAGVARGVAELSDALPAAGSKRRAEAPAEAEEAFAAGRPSVGNGEPERLRPPSWMGVALKWWRRG